MYLQARVCICICSNVSAHKSCVLICVCVCVRAASIKLMDEYTCFRCDSCNTRSGLSPAHCVLFPVTDGSSVFTRTRDKCYRIWPNHSNRNRPKITYCGNWLTASRQPWALMDSNSTYPSGHSLMFWYVYPEHRYENMNV